jgi:hypothetical protein
MRVGALVIGSVLLLAACGSTPTPAPGASAPSSTAGPASPAPATNAPSTATSPLAAAGSAAPTGAAAAETVPASCDALLASVTAYTGAIMATQSLGKPQHLSCEFQYDGGKGVIIVNIGAGGTQSAYDTLKAGTAAGGRTVTDVPNLGVAAFAVSKSGKPAGVTSLGSNGILYVVEGILTQAQDVALINDLMRLP